MRALSSTELLIVWEREISETPARRALALLEAACDEFHPDDLPRLTIGRRDDMLLTLRELTFGSHLPFLAPCPHCGEGLETELEVSDLRAKQPSDFPAELELHFEGESVRFRPPNSADLACLSSEDEVGVNQSRLLKRCLISATRDGCEIKPEELGEEVVNLMAEKLAQADPQADVQLALACPACGHSWSGIFDIVTYFWSEIHAWALRRLREVHVLASAYGWGEKEILSLSPQRRRVYLELVGL